MRKLIRRALGRLMPAKGTHRVQAAPTQPARVPRMLVVTTQAVFTVIDGDSVAMVRPYLVAYEQERERRRQRERHGALALAALGHDYVAVGA